MKRLTIGVAWLDGVRRQSYLDKTMIHGRRSTSIKHRDAYHPSVTVGIYIRMCCRKSIGTILLSSSTHTLAVADPRLSEGGGLVRFVALMTNEVI